VQRYMLRSRGIQEQVPAAIRAKEIDRARGKRKSTLYRPILVPARLHVSGHTGILRRGRIASEWTLLSPGDVNCIIRHTIIRLYDYAFSRS